jgi:hypothetical protein
MEPEIEDLKNLVLYKVRNGENLLQQVQCHFTAVEGRKKLERRIRSEMKFLQKANFTLMIKIRLIIYLIDFLFVPPSCWKPKQE